MKYAGTLLLAVVAVTTAVLAALGPLAPAAHATIPPGSICATAPTPTPGTGTSPWVLSATLPADAGQNANGVCINCTGTGGANNRASLISNAAGCAGTPPPTSILPTVDARGSYVSADWGTTSCVAPGNTVIIKFLSGSPVPVIATVTWNLADGSTLPGTATASIAAPVGGTADLPDAAGSSGTNHGLLAGLVAAGVAAVLALTAGGWYARRRFS